MALLAHLSRVRLPDRPRARVRLPDRPRARDLLEREGLSEPCPPRLQPRLDQASGPKAPPRSCPHGQGAFPWAERYLCGMGKSGRSAVQ